jgi:hypothetical protein
MPWWQIPAAIVVGGVGIWLWMTPSSEVTKKLKDVWKRLSTVDFIS